MSNIKTAPVNMFTTLRPRLLIGGLLRDIKSIQASIVRFGLLTPIIVSRANGRLIVVDGRKRLAAIKRLEFMGRLPRSLVNIPYIELGSNRQNATGIKGSTAPLLMSNRDLYVTITEMFQQTQDVSAIAADLFLTRKCVGQVLTLARLSPRLRRAFFDRTINFESAKAYAANPKHEAQERAFMKLGPFASEKAILDYMSQTSQKFAPLQNSALRLAA